MEKEFLDNHYRYFLAQNEMTMNGIFGRLLWYCCFVAPAIALGVFFDAFPDITYEACFQTLLVLLTFAAGHTVLCKFKPASPLIKYLGMVGLLIAINTMCTSHIGIHLTYFLVPMTSLLYCHRRTFIIVSVLSYFVMVLSNWQIAEYSASLRVDVDAVPWLIGILGGHTIEFLMMFVSGLLINTIVENHLHVMYSNEVHLYKSEHTSYTDVLTGLWNRRYMEKAFDKFVVVRHNSGAMLVVDMDHMKLVNDAYGHLEGDRALKVFAGVLKKAFADCENATICRFGGDEFVVLLPSISTVSDLSLYISKLISLSDEAFCNDEKLNPISISIGGAFVDELDMSYQGVFDRADKALYDVKKTGRNSYHIYSEV